MVTKINGNKTESKNISKQELNILFVGDIMTDRYIRKQINKYGSKCWNKILNLMAWIKKNDKLHG